MGGRGGGSGRGGGTASARHDREKTDHLASDYVGQLQGIEMLMKETGLSPNEAEMTYRALASYFGSGYTSIRAGHPPSALEKAKLIDNALKKARAYKGEIYRGISLDPSTYSEWAKQLRRGATIDMKGISSWSSNPKVAESFAHSSYGQSVIFKLKSTNHAVPV